MKKRSLRSFILLGILTSFVAPASSFATNLWWQNTATVGLNERWGVFGEFQPRWQNRMSDEQALLIRSALFYRVDPSLRFGLGFGWTPQYQPTERDESRFFEQVDYNLSQGDLSESIRGRLEQRFLEFTTGTAWRFRLKTQLSWTPGNLGGYVWNEIFYHLNDKPAQVKSGFDQNRFSVGPRLKFDFLTVEAGYLHQTIRRYSGLVVSDHGAQLGVSANFW